MPIIVLVVLLFASLVALFVMEVLNNRAVDKAFAVKDELIDALEMHIEDQDKMIECQNEMMTRLEAKIAFERSEPMLFKSKKATEVFKSLKESDDKFAREMASITEFACKIMQVTMEGRDLDDDVVSLSFEVASDIVLGYGLSGCTYAMVRDLARVVWKFGDEIDGKIDLDPEVTIGWFVNNPLYSVAL